jgi:hypothetical protein
MTHKNFAKVVWVILVQLRSLNKTMTMVSGVICIFRIPKIRRIDVEIWCF